MQGYPGYPGPQGGYGQQGGYSNQGYQGGYPSYAQGPPQGGYPGHQVCNVLHTITMRTSGTCLLACSHDPTRQRMLLLVHMV